MSGGSFQLDLLAQQPRINRLYTHLTLCYALRTQERAATTQVLSNACNALSRSLPWSAGKVAYDGTSFEMQYRGDDIRLVVKEVEEPTFEDLKAAHFPFSMIHESDYAPCKTVATDDARAATLPVFMIQATYVQGGLLLTFAGQHGAMDVVGLGQLMYFFSKLCRNEPLAKSELDIANAQRGADAPGPDAGSPLHGQSCRSDTAHLLTKSPEYSQPSAEIGGQSTNVTDDLRPCQSSTVRSATKMEGLTTSPSHQLVWAYFAFSNSSLNALKSRASERLVGETFVSTDDALTAFIWLSITRVRAQSSPDRASSSTTLSRQVDMRRYLSMPPTYTGLMVQETRHTISVDGLINQSLSNIAVHIRSALNSSSLIGDFREKVEGIISVDAESKSRDIPSLEVRLSSWSKVNCYELDLGFGKPACVRRPAFSDGARDGLVYFLPKEPDGSIAVALCLEGVDMRGLKGDAEFAKLAIYIG